MRERQRIGITRRLRPSQRSGYQRRREFQSVDAIDGIGGSEMVQGGIVERLLQAEARLHLGHEIKIAFGGCAAIAKASQEPVHASFSPPQRYSASMISAAVAPSRGQRAGPAEDYNRCHKEPNGANCWIDIQVVT